MKRDAFSLAEYKAVFIDKISGVDQKVLMQWSLDCVARVMPYFANYTDDLRPSEAIRVANEWLRTGIFRMSVIRKASLDSHAAARAVGEELPAKSVARAAGQAVAIAHVSTHAIGGAIYALQAIYRETHSWEAVEKEKVWQIHHLNDLRKHES